MDRAQWCALSAVGLGMLGVWALWRLSAQDSHASTAACETDGAGAARARQLAHDLRNPLTIIRARSEMLARKLDDRPAEQRQVEGILRAVGRLDQLIGKLGPSLP